MKSFLTRVFFGVLAVSFIGLSAADAYEVPRQNSDVHFFYVFGPDGDPLMGKEDSELELFVEIPASSSSPVTLSVYDPDTGGFEDWRTDVNVNPWDTEVEFTVYGSTQLDQKTFGADSYDQQYYQFGPYDVSQGEKVGDKVRFRLVAKGLKGDDQNLYKVGISPDYAESYVYNMTFRLLPRQGEQMRFYGYVPKGTSEVKVHNFDLDFEGGRGDLLEGPTQIRHEIADSRSGEWVTTDVSLGTSQGRRIAYRVIKGTQRHANAGVKMTDNAGNMIPIYFRKQDAWVAPAKPAPRKPAPKPVAKSTKCNTYTFDARDSYDVDNQKIEYLWDFGDGTTSTAPVTTHTFPNAGDYIVTLTVTDNSGLVCNTAVTTDKVNVNTPPTAAFTSPDFVCVNQSVRIDASDTTDNTPSNLTYKWNLGDGSTAEGKYITKAYSQGGTYKIHLNVDDNANSICSQDAAERVIRVNTPPVANAGKDISLCQSAAKKGFDVQLNASGSSDADRDNLTYSWDFGDGTTGTGARPNHTYENEGNYTARVTVTDSTGSPCSTAVDTVNVNLNSSPVAVAGKDISTCQGSEVVFDGSSSYDQGSSALTYTWDFGDGTTGTGRSPRHTYAQSGTYNVMLTVDDGSGTSCAIAKDALRVHVNGAPSVSLEDVSATCLGDSVSFKAKVTDPDSSNVKLTWDFGDGTVKEGGSSMTHKYAKGGFYTVTVTANDGSGSACSIATDTTYVEINSRPIANAGDNLACCVGEEVTFDGSASTDADSDALTYRWNFGDGTSAEGSRVKHTYTENGTYKVSLNVSDNSGTKCSESADGFTSVVNAKPVPVIKIN